MPARIFALVALIALAWQSIAIQSHVHFDSGAMQAAVHGSTRLQHRNAPADTPADCPICRQFAHAGHYLPPVAPTLATPAAFVAWIPIVLSAAWLGRRRSHAWRSRGPPSLLRT